MTYCLGLSLDAGLVLLSDSRTNAGVDNISIYGKMFSWGGGLGGGSALTMLTAGNLSVTQEIAQQIDENVAAAAADASRESLLTAPNMFRVAERIGALMADVQARRGAALASAGVSAGASLIVGGQVPGEGPRLFLIYQAGNFIEAKVDSPFLQIGEFKYGKPILDRMARRDMTLDEGVKLAGLSMDATVRSNLSVAPPFDLAVLRRDSFEWRRRRVTADDPGFVRLSRGWSDHLRAGYEAIPGLAWNEPSQG